MRMPRTVRVSTHDDTPCGGATLIMLQALGFTSSTFSFNLPVPRAGADLDPDEVQPQFRASACAARTLNAKEYSRAKL